jgi:hypothetical protein
MCALVMLVFPPNVKLFYILVENVTNSNISFAYRYVPAILQKVAICRALENL